MPLLLALLRKPIIFVVNVTYLIIALVDVFLHVSNIHKLHTKKSTAPNPVKYRGAADFVISMCWKYDEIVVELLFYLASQKSCGYFSGLHLHFIREASVLPLHQHNRAVEITRRYDGKYTGGRE